MTSIGAGLRLATSRSVPAEFAHGHMTENLVLDPSQVSPHTAVFDDAPPADGRLTVNICVRDPICGVVRLGYMTLDVGAYQEALQGHGDGQVGRGADQANGARDQQTGPWPADPYLKQLIEEGRRTAPALAAWGDDYGHVSNPLFQTYAEAFQTVQNVMDDSKHFSTVEAFLQTPDLTALGDYIAAPWNSSGSPVQLAAFRTSKQDDGSDRGEQPHAASPVSWLQRMGESLNPISTAQAAGPEEENRGRAEEVLDPRREAKVPTLHTPAVAAAKSADTTPGTIPPPIDPASLPPGPLNPADYERVGIRNKYLAGLYDRDSLIDRGLNLVTGAMADPANVLTPEQQTEHAALSAKLRETLFPPPTPDEARLGAMLDSPFGTAASVFVQMFGGSQHSQDVALGVGGALEGIGIAAGGARAGEATKFLNPQIGKYLPTLRLLVNQGQQNKHVAGTNNYIEGRSILLVDPQLLLDRYAGKGSSRGQLERGIPNSREVFDAGFVIGIYKDLTGREAPTTNGMIIYSGGYLAHVVPSTPNGWIK